MKKQLLLKYFLKSLVFTLILLPGISRAQVPVCKFAASKLKIGIYESIQLFDSSTNNPFEWEWNVYDSSIAQTGLYPSLDNGYVSSDPNGIGNNEFSRNPEFSFDVPGVYTITLRSKNSTGWSSRLIKKAYITVDLPNDYNIGFGSYGPNSDNVVFTPEGTIRDDGGVNNNYSFDQGIGSRSFLHIKPCKARSITLIMTQLKFNDVNDVLKVYDASYADNTKLLAAWTFNNTSNKTVTALSGEMYIIFSSNLNGNDSGFIGTYTSDIDTGSTNISLDLGNDSIFANYTPVEIGVNNTDIPGTPIYKWTVDGFEVIQPINKKFNYTFYTEGLYEICLKIVTCNEQINTCKTISIVHPTGKTQIDFKASSLYTNVVNEILLTPLTDKANRFEWTISPSTYTLLNPPSVPSSYGPGIIKYMFNPGDTLPKPKIRFLDTICYTISLKAYNSLEPDSTVDSITKTNYICGKPFQLEYPIFGNIFNDIDNDCIQDLSENGVGKIPVKLRDSLNTLVALTYSNDDGLFIFKANPGRYKVELALNNLPAKVDCPVKNDSLINYTGPNSFNGVHFPLRCTNNETDLAVKSYIAQGAIFPGQKHILRVNAGLAHLNICNQSAVSGSVKITVSGKLSYIEKAKYALSPSSINNNVFIYNISDFSTIDFYSSLALVFKTDTNATSDDSMVVNVEINPISGDSDTADNRARFVYKVRNSYDPNMKEVYPVDVNPGYNNWLNYTIHFQNTGNASAYNIRLQDTLDEQLLTETFELLDASHAMRLDMRGRNIKFFFDDIMLPDSFTDVEGSMGYVQYRIKPKANLPKGTKIYNTAYIFFDYNSPVVTNTTVTEFVAKNNSLEEIHSSLFSFYPNPGNGVYTLSGQTNCNLKVYSSTGEKLLDKQNCSSGTILDLSKYSSGIYIVRIEADGILYYLKLIKD